MAFSSSCTASGKRFWRLSSSARVRWASELLGSRAMAFWAASMRLRHVIGPREPLGELDPQRSAGRVVLDRLAQLGDGVRELPGARLELGDGEMLVGLGPAIDEEGPPQRRGRELSPFDGRPGREIGAAGQRRRDGDAAKGDLDAEPRRRPAAHASSRRSPGPAGRAWRRAIRSLVISRRKAAASVGSFSWAPVFSTSSASSR